MITILTQQVGCRRTAPFFLVFLLALIVGSPARALGTLPHEFGEALRAEWRGPVKNFLNSLGVTGAESEEVLDNTKTARVVRELREPPDGTMVVQFRHKRLRMEPAGAYVTAIGRISNDGFKSEVLFFAGDLWSGMDVVHSHFGGINFGLNFFTDSVVVTVMNTKQGWLVVSQPNSLTSGK